MASSDGTTPTQAHPARSEYRLFLLDDILCCRVSRRKDDTLFVCSRNRLLVIVAPPESNIESQLVWLRLAGTTPSSPFRHNNTGSKDGELDFAVRYILDELGLEAEEPEVDELDAVLENVWQEHSPAW